MVGAAGLIKTRLRLDKNMLSRTHTADITRRALNYMSRQMHTSVYISVSCVLKHSTKTKKHVLTVICPHIPIQTTVPNSPHLFQIWRWHKSLVLNTAWCFLHLWRKTNTAISWCWGGIVITHSSLCTAVPFGLCSDPHLSLTYMCVFLALTLHTGESFGPNSERYPSKFCFRISVAFQHAAQPLKNSACHIHFCSLRIIWISAMVAKQCAVISLKCRPQHTLLSGSDVSFAAENYIRIRLNAVLLYAYHYIILGVSWCQILKDRHKCMLSIS